MTKRQHVTQKQVVTAHMKGLLQHQIAELLDTSVSTVKRRLFGLNLPSNHLPNQIGKDGERLVAEILIAQGLSVEITPTGHPFDLWVAGLRVEVKTTGAWLDDDSFKFWIPDVRPSFRGVYFYPKDYQRETDFIVLAFLQEGELLHTYVIPSQLWKPNIRIHPASPFEPLREYRDAWALLKARSVAV